jgi:hypothetical protein
MITVAITVSICPLCGVIIKRIIDISPSITIGIRTSVLSTKR